MSLFGWLDALTERSSPAHGQRHGKFSKTTRGGVTRRMQRSIPRLEQLENRWLPSTGFSFAPIAILGNPAPGPEGGRFTADFEAGDLNNKGQVIFAADLDEGLGDIGEGIFLGGTGGLSQIFRVGELAPGGGTFGGFGSFSPNAINNSGDAAIAFGLDPLTKPYGVNAGVYRYSHVLGKLTAVLVPSVTPVPGGSGGEAFAGAGFHTDLNNVGDLVFTGIVSASIGPGTSIGLGAGIFAADKQGHLTKVVRPGDAAPGGNIFDFAENPAINDRGDVAFGAHISADPRLSLGQDLPTLIFSAESVYFRDGQTGVIQSIAHQGAAIPASAGGGTFDYAYAPVLNNQGQILFDAGLRGTSTVFNGSPVDSQAIFLYSGGTLTSIARQGDAMPGGGHLVSAAFNPGQYHLNNGGDVAFNALLDNGDEGVFLWSRGSLTLVAKTGTVVPGVGTIASLDQYSTGLPTSYVDLNDLGQVAFTAVLQSGGEALLLATPGGIGNSAVPRIVSPLAANLSPSAAALVPSGQTSSGSDSALATSQQPASPSRSREQPDMVVSQPATSSGKAAQSSIAKTFHRSAIDRIFATFPDGRWESVAAVTTPAFP
jgi:hypothetical protein